MALVNQDGVIENIIVVRDKFTPPENLILVDMEEGCGRSWTYVDGKFIPPVERPPQQRELTDIEKRLNKIEEILAM